MGCEGCGEGEFGAIEEGERTLGEGSLKKPVRFKKEDADKLRVKDRRLGCVGLRGRDSVGFIELLGRRFRTLRGGLGTLSFPVPLGFDSFSLRLQPDHHPF